jgi:hypothetical protein
VKRGHLAAVKFIPGAGGTQPSNGYNVTMIDADGADLFNPTGAAALGASLSNAAASWVAPGSIVEAGNVTPTVSGGGGLQDRDRRALYRSVSKGRASAVSC